MHEKQLWWCCDPLRQCMGLKGPHACVQVREPRAVLKEFGTVLPEDTVIRVHDSTADLRCAPLAFVESAQANCSALVAACTGSLDVVAPANRRSSQADFTPAAQNNCEVPKRYVQG